jgi:hypothetical protein
MEKSNTLSSNVIKMNKNLGEYIENSVKPYIFRSSNGLYYTVYPDQKNKTYTTSQDIHYKVYPFDELKIYLKNYVYWVVCWILRLMTGWLNLQAIYINNMGLSTNLYDKQFYEKFSKENFDEIVNLKLPKIPQLPLIVRNVLGADRKIFESKGFVRIISRHVNILDNYENLTKKQRKHIEYDGNKLKQLVNKKELVIKSFGANPNIPHIRVDNIDKVPITKLGLLYKKLYLDKYSKFNPNFTDKWIRLFISSSNTGLIWIEKDEEPIGVSGYYYTDKVLTTPFFGYDTEFKFTINYSLYRALSYLVHIESRRLNKIEHRSGGCKDFKKQRGTKGVYEYSMVKYNHLSFRKRLGWIYLHILTNIIEFVKFFIIR